MALVECLVKVGRQSHQLPSNRWIPAIPRGARILFRINTCKTVSKQTTLTTFRMNTYEKTGGGGARWRSHFWLRALASQINGYRTTDTRGS